MPTSERPYHHGDLRETLLRAAERMADADVSGGFSLRELAREAGVSHAAPYRHFRDRDELVLALAERWMGQFVAAQEAAVGSGDARADLLGVGSAYVRWAVEHPSRFRLLFDPAVNRPGDSPTPAFAELVGSHTALLRHAVAAAAQAGLVDDRDGAVGAALWSQVHGLAGLVLLGHIPADDVEAVLGALLR
jgi:AcrR family transcriptional regulator